MQQQQQRCSQLCHALLAWLEGLGRLARSCAFQRQTRILVPVPCAARLARAALTACTALRLRTLAHRCQQTAQETCRGSRLLLRPATTL